jgi:hypothetical protein
MIYLQPWLVPLWDTKNNETPIDPVSWGFNTSAVEGNGQVCEPLAG